jgi:hypothetical protein
MLCNAEGHMSMLNRSRSKECIKRAELDNAEYQLRKHENQYREGRRSSFFKTSSINSECAYQLWKRALLCNAEYQLRKHENQHREGWQ